ncbi:N-acetylglucosaminyl-phosphatidylinositol de-N-acetylase-like [Lineus longissimus]|uniref:N-acetylglucosaminyl-phosphatidylinositol de-N-acetylase-like n=1 Tax=Lineus longissimus TaxID=88925 RepID=UPI002B4EE79E
MMLELLFGLYGLFCIALYLFISKNPVHVSRFSRVGWKRKVLLVTAHPDDECMFFSPTILHLTSAGHKVFLLCLSTGDFYGQGETRRVELIRSCEVLGIPEEHVFIVDDKALPDDPKVNWDPERICFYAYDYVTKLDINTIITFDESGVSGHMNHKATHRAFWRCLFQDNLPQGVEFYCLKTTNILRKYISVLDLPISLLTSGFKFVFISDWENVIRGQKAMQAHWSQLTWFRMLYIIFSGYMVINTLKPLSLERPRHHPPNKS